MNFRPISRNSPLRAALSVASALSLAGCAGLSPDAGFRDVQTLSAVRLEQRVQWNRSPEDDKAAAEFTQNLLAQPLDADAAVQIALLNNRGLQATYGELGIAQAEVVSAGRLANPLVSAQRWSKGESFKSEIGIEFNFLSLLLLPKKLQMIKANFEYAKLRVADEVVRTAAEARGQYYRALAAQQTVALQQATVASAEAAAELAARQYNAGNLNLKKQARHQVFYAESLSQLARTRQLAFNEREKLNRVMGLWGTRTDWKLPDRLPEVPAERPRYDDLEALALEQRLDVQAAKQEMQVLAERLGITNATRFIETLAVGYGVLSESDAPRRFGPSIEFELPVFDQGTGRVARDDARVRQSAERLADLAINTRSEVREKYNDVLSAYEQVAHLQKAIVPLRRKILGQTQLFYNGMLEGVYDLLDSYRENVRTGQSVIDAVKEYWIAHAELGRAVGGRLPAPAEPVSFLDAKPLQKKPAAGAAQPGPSHSH
jgi:outer membrane protein TolC